jgi:hypothetical protein
VLFFVALRPLNTAVVRTYAVGQLRRIASETGVGQAALCADTAAYDLGCEVAAGQSLTVGNSVPEIIGLCPTE